MQGLARVANTTITEMVNPKSQVYKKLKPDLAAMNEQEIIRLISGEPRIMRRPVLSDGQRLVTGFSEEAFQTMLS